jgi:hypothetical protein
MSTTTVGDLLAHAETLTRAVRDQPAPLSRQAWGRFDATAYRLLDLITDLPPATPTNRPPTLTRLRDAYPTPLILLPARRHYTISQYAAHHGLPPATVHSRIRNGQLPATRLDGILRIHSRDDPAADQLTPADPTRPEPLDQLAATLGAIADLLTLDPHPAIPTPGQADRDALASRVLALTTVTARHALARLRLTDGKRPLLIGAYAEYALDTLNLTDASDSTLTQIPSFHPPANPATPIERLEAALRGWSHTAHHELERSIPSTAVLANIATTGIHLYAVADQITLARADLGRLPTREAALARRQFRHTAQALDHARRLWAAVTTAQRPTQTYASATSLLDQTLSDLTHHGPHPRTSVDLAAQIDLDQAMVELRYAAADLRQLTHRAVPLPLQLARSGLLFAPARVLQRTPERIIAVNHRRYIAANQGDITTLSAAVKGGAEATRHGEAGFAVTALQRARAEHGIASLRTPGPAPEL